MFLYSHVKNILKIQIMKKASLIQEFKKFAMKGNVLDMAVGVIIGSAFGKIVSSLVGDIIMPLVGRVIAGVRFTDLKVVLKAATTDASGKDIAAITLNYGQFIQTVFDFLIIAISIFIFIKLINKFKNKKDEAPVVAPKPSKEEILLTEIRDLLKDKK